MNFNEIKPFYFEEFKDDTTPRIFWIINDLSSLNHKVKRIFFVKCEQRESRGRHAHKDCWQTLVSLQGKIEVHLEDGKAKKKVKLDTPGKSITIPPGIWASQIYDKEAYLMVLCSHEYDEDEYIRDYQEFLDYKNL